MNCPVCRTTVLALTFLEPDLRAMTCPDCHGNFIANESYWHWHDSFATTTPIATAEGELAPLVSGETATLPKRCPECGAPLLPYRIGHNLPFRVDRCAHCHGVWLDGNEWEILKSRGMQGDLDRVFTDPYQHAVVREERRQLHESNLRTRFGDDDFERARDIKAWIDSHPERHALLAYLHGEEI